MNSKGGRFGNFLERFGKSRPWQKVKKGWEMKLMEDEDDLKFEEAEQECDKSCADAGR